MNKPKHILIDNFNGCNFKCTLCDHKNMKRKAEKLPMDVHHRLIDEIMTLNPDATVWEVFFGEPTLLYDIVYRFKYAKDAGIKNIVVNSNGLRLLPNVTQSYRFYGCNKIYVGIDAATKKTYDKLRMGGDFQKVVNNIDIWEGEFAQDTLVPQFVVNDINKHEVETFKDYWLSRGFYVKIRPMVTWANLIGENNEIDNSKRKPCKWLDECLNICSNGNVAFCSCDVHCEIAYGNIYKQSLEEIWNGELAEYRQAQQEKAWDKLPERCRTCTDWAFDYSETFKPD